jgi:hypothetical protein
MFDEQQRVDAMKAAAAADAASRPMPISGIAESSIDRKVRFSSLVVYRLLKPGAGMD